MSEDNVSKDPRAVAEAAELAEKIRSGKPIETAMASFDSRAIMREEYEKWAQPEFRRCCDFDTFMKGMKSARVQVNHKIGHWSMALNETELRNWARYAVIRAGVDHIEEETKKRINDLKTRASLAYTTMDMSVKDRSPTKPPEEWFLDPIAATIHEIVESKDSEHPVITIIKEIVGKR